MDRDELNQPQPSQYANTAQVKEPDRALLPASPAEKTISALIPLRPQMWMSNSPLARSPGVP
jgi:hypothetical protein